MLTGLVVALGALSMGCAAQGEKPALRGRAALTDSPPGDPRYAQAWINTERRPIDQLKAIGSTMVGLVAESGGLLVVARATFWCLADTRYELTRGYIGPDRKPHFDRPGGPLAVTCDALGRQVHALPGLDATIAAGAHVGSYIVVATPNGYIGFQVR